jgi:hypothetical protein
MHYTDEGLEVIYLILKQMNNNRLSTNGNQSEAMDRTLLQIRINKILNEPSNFEIKEDGKIYIKSLDRYYYNNTKTVGVQLQDENGLPLKTYNSITECAKDLGISKSGVQKRLNNNIQFVFDKKTVYLKRIK